jgi:hypothetical protein
MAANVPKEDGYHSNCTLVEMTPFDIAILFGKFRPVTDANGQGAVAEMYERQVYHLSHRQAMALYEGLGRSLASLRQLARQAEAQETKPEGNAEKE